MEDSIVLSSQHVGRDKLHMAYNSALLVDEPISAKLMRDTLKKVQQLPKIYVTLYLEP